MNFFLAGEVNYQLRCSGQRKGTDVIFTNESEREQAAPFPGSGSIYSNEQHLEMSPKQVLFQTQLFRVPCLHRIISSYISISSSMILSSDDIRRIFYSILSPYSHPVKPALVFFLLSPFFSLLCSCSVTDPHSTGTSGSHYLPDHFQK